MSTNPPSFRIAWESQIAKLPPEHQTVIRSQMNAFTDLYQAVTALNTKVEGVKSSAASTAASVENVTNNSETIIQQVANVIGFVNSQIGTSYVTLPSDYGAFIIFNDASAIAVTLSTLGSGGGITLPWYAWVWNEGAGLVTLTPASGTISYPNNLAAASMPVPQGFAAYVEYDGTNFYGVLASAPPSNTPAISHEWINSFNSTTGVFGQSQPAFSDISGTVAASQLPDPTTSALGGVQANAPISHEWINAINTSGVPQLSQPTAADVVPSSSTTSGRPTGVGIGFMDFDTTLGIPIWWNGTAWVNSSGTPV